MENSFIEIKSPVKDEERNVFTTEQSYCDLLHFSTTKIRIKLIYPAIFSNAFLHLWKLTLNYCYEKILGLDLGTSSIGWALVNEAETSEEKSSIIKLGASKTL